MPAFTYTARTAAGELRTATVEAATAQDVVAQLRRQRMSVVKVDEQTKTKKVKGGIKMRDIVIFTRQFSTMINAGLPLVQALDILAKQTENKVLAAVTRDIVFDVESGHTVADALAKHPKAFSELYVNMVAAGEAGGVLDVILQRLAEFMEKAEKLKKKIIGAMIYPAVVVGFAMTIVVGIMIFVIPKFKDIFMDFDVDLPPVTMVLLNTSDWVVHGKPLPGWLVILGAPFAAYMLFKLIRSSQGGRFGVDFVTLKIPVLGNLVQKNSVARFARTLGTLISAGVPILEALKITKETSGNEVYARALEKVHDSIREGESFAAPLRAASVVDGLVVNMIDVGEETGELDKMLLKVADTYEEEVDVAVASLVSLLEPIMVVMLGGIVGFIVIALFMPLVQLISSVSSG